MGVSESKGRMNTRIRILRAPHTGKYPGLSEAPYLIDDGCGCRLWFSRSMISPTEIARCSMQISSRFVDPPAILGWIFFLIRKLRPDASLRMRSGELQKCPGWCARTLSAALLELEASNVPRSKPLTCSCSSPKQTLNTEAQLWDFCSTARKGKP